jgi:hypothetical protein
VNLNRGLRVFCFGTPAIFSPKPDLFELRHFHSAALVIFHVLA